MGSVVGWERGAHVEHFVEPQATPTGWRSGILLGVSRRSLRLGAACAAVAAFAALAGCGSTGGGAATPRPTAKAKATASQRLAKAPAALRANAADANTLAGDGDDALKARLAKLRGHPVVVNQWASWCGPCRYEFPFFADAVVEHGDKVAFVGIDFTDNRGDAEDFLRDSPPGFASIYDHEGAAARSLGGGRVAPTTFFIGRDGERVHTKLGGYANANALEADIRRYALGSQ
jgi:cytochrome c biogenesis protein CcmG/thiol:disulfide interchange protein DsbE